MEKIITSLSVTLFLLTNVTMYAQSTFSQENTQSTFSQENIQSTFSQENAQSTFSQEKNTHTLKRKFDLIETIKDLLLDSDNFLSNKQSILVNYGLISNRGQRIDIKETTLPSLDLMYERQIWHNMGVRVAVGSHWWEEQKLLAQSTTELFYENFKYKYWTFGSGITWHLNVNDKWDPYLGLMTTVRWVQASCNCYDINQTLLTLDIYAGTRYVLNKRFFLVGELGRHQTSFIKIGSGIKF
jgi:hypothetical protein